MPQTFCKIFIIYKNFCVDLPQVMFSYQYFLVLWIFIVLEIIHTRTLIINNRFIVSLQIWRLFLYLAVCSS